MSTESIRVGGPTTLELILGLRRFWKDEVNELRNLHSRYGDVVKVRMAGYWMYLVCHPELIEKVMVKHAQSFTKDYQTLELSEFLGEGLLTSEGEVWRRKRRIAAPFLTRKHILGYSTSVIERTQIAAEVLAQETSDIGHSDLHAVMMRLTLDIVLDTLFGVDIDPGDYEIIHDGVGMAMTYFDLKNHSIRRFFPTVNGPNRRKYLKAMAALDGVLFRLIETKRRNLDPESGDLLTRLLLSADEDGQLTDKELRDEAMTMVVAGHETTALACTYAILLLHGQAPEFLQVVREELATSPSRARFVAGELAASQAVVKEALRLVPPAWVVGRAALEDVDLGAVMIPKGTQVYMPQCVVQRDARWFDSPTSYAPQRWMNPEFESSLPRFAYFPFGGGPRICIGNHFAMMEAILIVANLLYDLDIDLESKFEDLDFTPSITLRPKGPVWIRAHLRS